LFQNNLMPRFKFKSIDKDGKAYEDVREAPGKLNIYRDLQSRGETVVFVEQINRANSFDFKRLLDSVSFVGMHEKIVFARNLGAMVKAGLSLSRALSIIEKQTRKAKFKKIIAELQNNIRQGKTFNESLGAYPKIFSPLFVSMVKAGEESGNLSENLKIIANQMEKSYRLRRKIRGAMIYPAIIVSVMIAIGILMLTFIVPTLTDTFEGLDLELPLSTRSLIFASRLLRDRTIIIVLAAILLASLIITAFRTKRGKRIIDFSILRIPIIAGITKEINSARTARTLSSLLSSGVDIVVALSITREVIQNSYYKEVLKEAAASIGKGKTMSDIFGRSEHLYPVFVGEMINVGEETGKLSEMLLNVAVFYEDSVSEKTKDMSTVIEPFLMVAIGIAVGFFAIAMMSPTLSLVDSI